MHLRVPGGFCFELASLSRTGLPDRLHTLKVDVNGVKLVRDPAATSGGVGVGLSRNWKDDRYSLYGEVETETALKHFGDSWMVHGTIGLRMAF
jgi:type V secretory pathway adhesin AidA